VHQMIEKVEDMLRRIIELFGNIAMILLLCCCLLQVFTRYVLNDSLTWTEELARFSFIWVSFLGTSLCVKNGTHARITVISDFMPKPIQNTMRYIGYVIIVICCYVMITEGFGLMATVAIQKSPMLRIPMSVFYGACPVGAIFVGLFALLKIVGGIWTLFEPKKEGAA
jgi:TRAP-type C4-dicarboxylate transport system permease small subunit